MSSAPSASPSAFTGRVTLVGAGKMGFALLQGWLAQGVSPARIAVHEPSPAAPLQALAAQGLALNPATPAQADALVLAVKPQAGDTVLPPLAAAVGPDTVVVSIMAGKTLDYLARFFPQAALVRTMPNTPAAIGRGITAAVARGASAKQKADATALLAAAGAVEWIEDEALMDAVTAVSGSGPAYVFLLAECLAAAGAKAGLPADLAARLANETVAGAGELLRRSGEEAATLRQNVTSPGGTTAAALAVLMRDLPALMTEAIAAAAKRSRELAG